MQFSFCSRSSRTGVGFPFFHICLFLRLNQPVFVYSLVRDTDISFQILKKALYLFHLFPQSPDFVVTLPPPSFTALKPRAHYVDPSGFRLCRLTSARDRVALVNYCFLFTPQSLIHFTHTCTLLSLSPAVCCAFRVRLLDDDP